MSNVTALDRSVRRLTVSQALAAGDERALLVAQLEVVAEAIDSGPAARDLAALTRRMQELSKDLRAYDAEHEHDAGSGAATDGRFNPSAI